MFGILRNNITAMRKSRNDIRENGTVPSSGRRRSSFYLRVGIALILICVIFRWVDFRVVMQTILKTDLRYMVLILALALFDRYLMAYKWNILLKRRCKGSYLISKRSSTSGSRFCRAGGMLLPFQRSCFWEPGFAFCRTLWGREIHNGEDVTRKSRSFMRW